MTFEDRLAELGVDLSDLKPVAERRYDREGHPVTLQAALMDYYADVIDRMETRIVNLTGELNYIKQTFMNCVTCTEGSVLHSDRCNSCDENYSHYEFAGVLEGWRPDDGC